MTDPTISNIGHLVTIKNTSNGSCEFIFLCIRGDESSDVYKKVIQGIRTLRLPTMLKAITNIRVETVTDFSGIDREYPDTVGQKVRKVPVTSFFDAGKSAFKEELFLFCVRNVIKKKGNFFPMNRSGAVTTGSDFFDREDIIKKIWKHIGKGENISLCGPRRYGKTSILREIGNEAALHSFSPVMIDLESVFTPQEFVAKIWVQAERPGVTEIAKQEKAAGIEEKINERWDEEGKKLFDKLSIGRGKRLFLLDECSYMLDSFLGKDAPERDEIGSSARKKTDHFIQWFKEQRARSASRCVFVITGSVHPKPYLEDNDLDKNAFSDCKEVRLNFFGPKTVRLYVESLLLGEEVFLKDEVIDELVTLCTPGIPYFIQILMNHVAALYRRNPAFSVKDLRQTYHEKVVGPEGRRHFDTFERHFKRYGRQMPGARELLRELSSAGKKGLKMRELERIYRASSSFAANSTLEIMLEYLAYDFYIEKVKGTDRYRFASPMLRDYWRRNQ